jgi:serine/threonine protein phosphatase 1
MRDGIDPTEAFAAEAAGASAVYAVGDIHGRLDLLEGIEAAIGEDVARTRPARPVICYLGDYIDRGPQSAAVLERLSAPACDGVARVFLKGNHEDRMLAFLADPAANGPRWMQYGGREALESYAIRVPEAVADTAWAGLRDELAERLPERHLRFLRELRLAFAWERYLFVHAGLNPDRPTDDQDPHDLMWIREPFLSSGRDWGRIVVHGHVIVEEPQLRPNRIGIDTGAYRSGRLTCLVATAGAPRLLTAYSS